MRRVLPLWAHHALIALTAALVGACVGMALAPDGSVHTLAYCSVEPSGASGTPPCPPETNTLVWAAWTPGLRIPATWTGTHWRLSQPVMGISTTTVPPVAWGEL